MKSWYKRILKKLLTFFSIDCLMALCLVVFKENLHYVSVCLCQYFVF